MSNPHNPNDPHDPTNLNPSDPLNVGAGSTGDPFNTGDPVIGPRDPLPGDAPEGLGGRTRGRDLIPPPPLSYGGITDEIEIVAEPARTGPGAKRVGLLMAAALALIGGGVGLLLWQRGTPKPMPGSQAQRAPTSVPVRPETPPAPPSKDDPGIAGVTASQTARMQFMDRRDPSRVAGELRYSKLEPLERGQQLIFEPRAWIYLRDGSTVHVQSAKAKLTTPNAGDKPQEPESGTFDGNVIVRMYSAGGDGKHRTLDVNVDRPSLMFTTDVFTFNTVLSEVSTASTWQASAPAWDYTARGMRLVYDEVSQRAELFETDGDNVAKYYAGDDAENPTQPATASTTPDAAPANPDGASPSAPVAGASSAAPTAATVDEVIYRAVLSGPVMLTGKTQSLQAPGGTVWVRLIDGSLRPGAIAPVEFKGEGPTANAGTAPTGTPVAAGPDLDPTRAATSDEKTDSTKDGTVPLARGNDAPSGTLTWPGPITVRPVEQAAELARGDDVRVRLDGDDPKAVVIKDDESGLSGYSKALEYGATTRELMLSGPGEAGVFFAAAGGQSFEAEEVRVDLANGKIHTTGLGRGVLNGPGVPSAQAAAFREISWDKSATFSFEMQGGAMTSFLRRAEFNGVSPGSRSVVATDQRSSLSGDSFVAEFTKTSASPNVLSKVTVTGAALAQGGEAGSLGSDALAIEFTPDASGKEGEPTRVVARGNVIGQRDGTVLRTDILETGLARDAKDNIGATIVTADGHVRFDRPDGVGATAQLLTADARAQTVTLTGDLGSDPASVYKDKTVITAGKIDLDGAASTMLVTGAGSFSHEETRVKGSRGDEPGMEGLGDPDIKRAEATWTKGMRFNNVTGVLECEGEVFAMTDPTGLRVDLVRGNRVRLELAPAGDSSADKERGLDGLANAGADKSENRRLLRAEVFGHSYDEQGGAPAVVESRQFTAATNDDGTTGARTLERLLYIEGDHVIADVLADTMNVPGPGKALVDDRRRPDPHDGGAKPVLASQPSDLAAIGKTVGSSLFIWDGSLLFERRTGVLDLQRFVRVVHQPVDDPTVVKMEADRLTATLRSRRGLEGQAPPAAGLTGKGSAELVKLDAYAAYLGSQVPGKAGTSRELICDRLFYNADAQTVEALASENNRVRLFDQTKGTAVDAERLFWDIATDRTEILKPTPITSPR